MVRLYGLRVNHYDFVALHSMWIIFLKGYCVLVRVEIIHKSKFQNFDLCIISTRIKTQ